MGNRKVLRLDQRLIALAALWVLGIGIGCYAMLRHEYTVGEFAPASARLPEELATTASENDAEITLAMAIHPECPCTRASVEQLDRLLAQHTSSLRAVAYFWIPEGSSKRSLSENAYWKRLSHLPNVTVATDPGGKVAAKLGAIVSGSVAAYDRNGELRFQGGLTPSRGHAGSSFGMDAINSLLNHAAPHSTDPKLAPSFGCALEENGDPSDA